MQFTNVHHSIRYINGVKRFSNIQLECRDTSILMIDAIHRFQFVGQDKDKPEEYRRSRELEDDPQQVYEYFKYMRQRRIECQIEINETNMGAKILKIKPERKSINQLWIDCRSVFHTKNRETEQLKAPKPASVTNRKTRQGK